MSGKVIAITSGKGGVGKTSVVANMGVALATESPMLKICLIDLDIGLSNLDLHLGLEQSIKYTIADHIAGEASVDDILVTDSRIMNLSFIASSQKHFKDEITVEHTQTLIKNLKTKFDLIIIDCPAGIEGGFRQAMAVADEAILVTQPDIVSVRDADKVKNLIEIEYSRIAPWLIINRVNPSLLRNNQIMSIEDIVGALQAKLLGVVPEDIDLYLSVQRGIPVCLDIHNMLSGQAFRNIAKRLLGEDIPVIDLLNMYENKVHSFMNKFKDMFGIH